MARRRAHAPLSLFVNGRLAGVLRRDASGAISFRYAETWLAWEQAFPVSLSLPLREDRYVGAPVFNVFDNLLPDGESIRRRIAERVGAYGVDAYSLLEVLGRDCVGALQFLPEGDVPGRVGAVEGEPMSPEAIGDLLDSLAVAPLGLRKDEAFRISIAGAQEKTALLRRDGIWLKPTGSSATTHILKPPVGRLPDGIDMSDSVENEYVCLRLLAALGVPVARADIAEFAGRKTLVVERFDRLWTDDGRLLRRPQEDMCQALSVPSTRKYQSDGGPGMPEIIGLLKGSDVPEHDIGMFLRACLVFWMLGATDGHAKNVSIALGPGGRFRLTPFYDVLSAQPSMDAGRIRHAAFRLAMSVGRNRHYAVDEIQPRHFVQTAAIAGVGKKLLASVMEDLAETAVGRAQQATVGLPGSVPPGLLDSLMEAVAVRARLLREGLGQASESAGGA